MLCVTYCISKSYICMYFKDFFSFLAKLMFWLFFYLQASCLGIESLQIIGGALVNALGGVADVAYESGVPCAGSVTKRERILIGRIQELERKVLEQKEELETVKAAYTESLSDLLSKQQKYVAKVEEACSEGYTAKVSIFCLSILVSIGVIFKMVRN